MADLTMRQDSASAKQRDQLLSISSLDRLADLEQDHSGAHAIALPTGIRFYMIGEDTLLASDRRNREPKEEAGHEPS